MLKYSNPICPLNSLGIALQVHTQHSELKHNLTEGTEGSPFIAEDPKWARYLSYLEDIFFILYEVTNAKT